MIPMASGWITCTSKTTQASAITGLGVLRSGHRSGKADGNICIHQILALLLFPSLCGFPFIFLVEKALRSPVETASPLFANRFLPPNPNFSFRFCLLFGGARRPSRAALSSLLASSSATSKRSSSFVAPVSALFRSVVQHH